MLRSKPNSEIEVVCISDPALDEVPVEKVRQYQLSRRIEDLGDLGKLPEKPTVFRCKPLAQRYEALVDDPTSEDMWLVFAHHVTSVSGFADERGTEVKIPMEDVRGELVVAKAARDMIGREAVNEVASVIVQRCNGRNGDTTPFFTPDGWQQGRIQRATLHALKGAAQTRETAP